MDPFSALGGVAAITELLGLCIKSAKTAKELYRSFKDAPVELDRVATKLSLVNHQIRQIQQFGEELSDANMKDLIPELYQNLLLSALQAPASALGELKSMADQQLIKSPGSRLLWATLDKHKAKRIIQDISAIEDTLSLSLNILNMRLSTLSQTSLGAVRASQNVMLPILESTHNELLISFEEAHKAQQRVSSDLSENLALTRQISSTLDRLVRSQHSSKIYGYCMTESLSSSRKFPVSSQGYMDATAGETYPFEDWDEEIENISLRRSAWYYGKNGSDDKLGASRLTAGYQYHRRRFNRDIRLEMRVAFHLFGKRVLNFEVGIRQVARAFIQVPWMSSRISIKNIRPSDSPIFVACARHDLGAIRRLLESGDASIQDVDPDGMGLLGHVFSKSARVGVPLKVPEYLVRMGCTTNDICAEERSILAYNLLFGMVPVVRLLLTHGADAHNTALGGSLDGSSVAILREEVQLLRSWDVSFNEVEDHPHNTILHVAASAGDLQIVLFAVTELKVDINGLDSSRQTPLICALSQSHIGIVAALYAAGAALDESTTVASLFVSCGTQDANFRALHWSLSHNARRTHSWNINFNPWNVFWLNLAVDIADLGQGVEGLLRFRSVVIAAAHLLFHGFGPFEVITGLHVSYMLKCFRIFSLTPLSAAELVNVMDAELELDGEMPLMQLKNDSEWATGIMSAEDFASFDRFPLATAMCCALKMAGYMAEMDGSGEIFFDAMGEDQWFDAQEQPSFLDEIDETEFGDESDDFGEFGEDDGKDYCANCPICQDPRLYGLEFIFEAASDGINAYQEILRRKRDK